MEEILKNQIKELRKQKLNSQQISEQLNHSKLEIDLYLAELYYDKRKRPKGFIDRADFLQTVEELYKDNSKCVELAAKLNIYPDKFYYYLRKAGIYFYSICRNYKKQYMDTEALIADFKSGIPVYQLAKKYDLSKNILAKFLRELGEDPTRCHCNEFVFDQIDSHEKAYWLGFLYADGAVDSKGFGLELQLKLTDLDHLIKFHRFMQSINTIRYKKIQDGKYFSCRTEVYSKHLHETLCNLGCTPKKSLTLTFPNEKQVPKEYIHSFICGYFDGDGCISYVTQTKKNVKYAHPDVKMVGTKEFLEGIVQCFPNLDYRLTKDRNHYCLDIKSASVKNFLDTIYSGGNYLNRKYNRYLLFKNNNFAVQLSDFLDNDRAISEKAKEFVNSYFKEQILC